MAKHLITDLHNIKELLLYATHSHQLKHHTTDAYAWHI